MCVKIDLVMPILWFLVLIVIIDVARTEGNAPPTNIVFIIADDLGWDDVSFHGSDQVLTPNIDLLAYSGVALERYYSHCVCTPSRSALLSGKYAYTTGMQGYPLTNSEDRGLPITEKILPQYLKELGYATHLVGKWHVGLSREQYLPTNRGFDSHFGHRGGFLDYYEYVLQETWNSSQVAGIDLYRNMTIEWDAEGYITDLYNQEAKSIIKQHNTKTPLFLMVAHNAPHAANQGAVLQAPPEEIRAMRHVESPQRRTYSAMVKKLDDSVGDIFNALHEKGILNNTVIVFTSDNGGITVGESINYASNWPLRGTKLSPFEGGVRIAGLVWSPNMNRSNHIWNGYMHMIDWLPTLIRAAGFEPPKDIDGIDHWESILQNKESEREEIFEIDDFNGFASVISGDFKLVIGNATTIYCGHHGGDLRGVIGTKPSYSDAIRKSKVYSVMRNTGKAFKMKDTDLRKDIKVKCNSNSLDDICFPQNGKSCLYNIKKDPCEYKDVSYEYPEVLSKLEARLQEEILRMIPRHPIYRDPQSAPSLHNFTWSPWL